MISQLLRKWFNLPLPPCNMCEVLRDQLEKSEGERRELMHKLLEKDKVEPAPVAQSETFEPIKPQFIPWRVRKEMLEAEDRKAAALMRASAKEIKDLENELLPELNSVQAGETK